MQRMRIDAGSSLPMAWYVRRYAQLFMVQNLPKLPAFLSHLESWIAHLPTRPSLLNYIRSASRQTSLGSNPACGTIFFWGSFPANFEWVSHLPSFIEEGINN